MLQETTTSSEIWKDIPGYDGLYKISSHGKVISLRKQRVLSLRKNGKGYIQVGLTKDGEENRFLLGRLVGICFLRPPKVYEEINHIDGDKSNNQVSNLEWKSHQKNMDHAAKNGLMRSGRNHPLSKKVIDTSSGQVFDSLEQAAKSVGISGELLCMYLKGRLRNKTTFAYQN